MTSFAHLGFDAMLLDSVTILREEESLELLMLGDLHTISVLGLGHYFPSPRVVLSPS